MKKKLTLKEAAHAWMQANPATMDLFRRFARELAEANRRFGFRLLAERVRWEFYIGAQLGEFKLNDHYTPYIARQIVSEVPAIAGLIECRVTKAADLPERMGRAVSVDPKTEVPV